MDEHGQREPIWIIGHEIIDGRNRYKACQELDVEPLTRQYEGPRTLSDLIAFVVSLNKVRRHMSSSQLAFAALNIKEMYDVAAKERQRQAGGDHGNQYTGGKMAVPQIIAEPPGDKSAGEARQKAAEHVGTNRQYVSDAEKIKREAPALAEAVINGMMSIPEAKSKLREEAKKAEQQQRETDLVLQRARESADAQARRAARHYLCLGTTLVPVIITICVSYSFPVPFSHPFLYRKGGLGRILGKCFPRHFPTTFVPGKMKIIRRPNAEFIFPHSFPHEKRLGKCIFSKPDFCPTQKHPWENGLRFGFLMRYSIFPRFFKNALSQKSWENAETAS